MQTSAADIYASGDVAEAYGKIDGIIPVAIDQSKIAALNILGGSATHQSTLHPFTLNVSGIKLASIGDVYSSGGDYEERKKVDIEHGIYTKLVFRKDVLVGAILLGDTTKLRTLQKIVVQRQEVSKFKDSLLDGDISKIV